MRDDAMQGVSTSLNVTAALAILLHGQQRWKDVVMVVERRCSRGRNESCVACDSQFHYDVLTLSLMKGAFKTVSAALEASPCTTTSVWHRSAQ